MISIAGLNKAEVLAGLYNAARPQGMGFLEYDPSPMTIDEAEEILGKYSRFDYLKGRVMKVNLSGEEFDERMYDRDNGVGTAHGVVLMIQQGLGSNADLIQLHHDNATAAAAYEVAANIDEETTQTDEGGMAVFKLGLKDQAERLKPKIQEVLKDK